MQEAARAAVPGAAFAMGASGPKSPSYQRLRGDAAPVRRQHGLPTEPELPLRGTQRCTRSGRRVVRLERVGTGEAGLEPRVVGRRRVEVAGVEVAGSHALVPGTHAGARIAPPPGRRTTSDTVATSPSGTTATVTAQAQPR